MTDLEIILDYVEETFGAGEYMKLVDYLYNKSIELGEGDDGNTRVRMEDG